MRFFIHQKIKKLSDKEIAEQIAVVFAKSQILQITPQKI